MKPPAKRNLGKGSPRSSDFERFLRAAKGVTYAARGDSASVRSALPSSKQLEYSDGPWKYLDVYFGMRRFAGIEVVSLNGRPLWSMAYAGGLVARLPRGAPDLSAIYRFLREALRAVPAGRPFRGPLGLVRGDLVYRNRTNGRVGRFWGSETIRWKGARVYELRYAGGDLE